MRRIVASLQISVDGVVGAPEKWAHSYLSEDMLKEIQASMQEVDTLLLGRRTYQEFAAYWPHQDAKSDPFAGFLNQVRKLVVSNTLDSVEWKGSSLISGEVIKEITELKQEPGKDILVLGSPTLVRSLLEAGLLDELELMLVRHVVGTGKHLFEGADQVPLKLTDSRTFDIGVLGLRYEPASS